MRVWLWSAIGLLAGLVVGYALVVSAWLGYSLLAGLDDRDGSGLAGVALVAAPLGALAGGLIGAFCLALRAALRSERPAVTPSRPASGAANRDPRRWS